MTRESEPAEPVAPTEAAAQTTPDVGPDAGPEDAPEDGPEVADEVATLRKDLRDVIAVLSLPLMWRGRTPPQIAESLGEVLASLLRLDFLHLAIEPGASGQAIEHTRQPGELLPDARGALERFEGGAGAAGGVVEIGVGDGPPLRLARVEPGVQPEAWRVVAGARRSGFPTDRERFLMRVTVEQAAVSIETSRLFHEAQQASHAKSQFIATMSHELRTPLNAILGYVDLLLLGVPDPVSEPSRAHIDRIRTSARHLLELIDSILSFARMEADHEEVHLESLDLAALTRECAELLEPIARRNGLDFRCEVPDDAVPVRTDRSKVRQVLFNLLGNAIKFTDRGGVTIRFEADAREARIAVTDSGVGIPAREIDQIFEPFRQVEDSLTRRTGGTGLGLSVVRGLCDLLGARLDVESELGKGSTFTVRMGVAGSA